MIRRSVAVTVMAMTLGGLAGAAQAATPTRPALPGLAPLAGRSLSSPRRGPRSLSPAARAAVSRGIGHAQVCFHIARGGGGSLLARGGGLSDHFTLGGVTVSDREGGLHLALTGLGRGASVRAVGAASPSVSANRVSYAHAGVSEWYANGPLGLEQGFTIARRPAGSGALTLVAGSAGGGAVSANGSSLTVAGLSYGDLQVTDADGNAVPARIALSHGRIRLIVDDAGALYPLRIDPLVNEAEMTGSDTASGDYLGGPWGSLAITPDGSTIVVGAPPHDDTAGAAYVFERPATGGWGAASGASAQVAELTGPPGRIGHSVAISTDGSTIAVGATTAAGNDGTVYVYAQPSSGGWAAAPDPDTPTAVLTASDGASGDGLGYSVAISGDGSTIAAGAPSHDSDTGAGYIWLQPPGGWTAASDPELQTVELTDSTSAHALGTGAAISSDGDTVALGNPYGYSGDGAVDVYTAPDPGGWQADAGQTVDQQGLLQPSNPQADDAFGEATAMSADGSTVVTGAPGYDSDNGSVYVFTEPPSGWAAASGGQTQATQLLASDPSGDDFLGYSVAVSPDGSTVVGGAPNGPNGNGVGAVYLYDEPGGGWASNPTLTQTQEVDNPNGDNEAYGGSVAIAGDSGPMAVGAPYGGPSGGGAVYVVGTPDTTSTSVSCNPSSVVIGQTTTCTATVTDTADSAVTPTGTVDVTVDGGDTAASGVTDSPCTLAPTGISGQASCQVTYTGTNHQPKNDPVSADYEPANAGFATSSGSTTIAISYRPTSTSVSCVPRQFPLGQGTTCTATVTDTGAGTAPAPPAGLVTFSSAKPDSFPSGSTCTLDPTGATTSQCTVDDITPTHTGKQTIKARYTNANGQSYDLPSTGTTSISVTH